MGKLRPTTEESGTSLSLPGTQDTLTQRTFRHTYVCSPLTGQGFAHQATKPGLLNTQRCLEKTSMGVYKGREWGQKDRVMDL